MQSDVLPVDIKGVIPTSNGSALFLGTSKKTIVIYLDPSMGNLILMALRGDKKERPMTHDLIENIFSGLKIKVERVIINDVDEGTFFARLILRMDNELGTKLIEVDARPSDCIILALHSSRPIFIGQSVLDSLDDMTEILERIQKQQKQGF